MKYLQSSLIIGSIIFFFLHFSANAQNGNYAIRDSTLNLPLSNNTTIVGTKAAPDLNASSNNDNTLFGSYAGFKLNTGGGFNSISGLTLIGSRAGYNYLTTNRGISNATFIGAFAGYNDGTGVQFINNGTRGGTFIGYKAGYAGGNPESIAIGIEAGLNGVALNSIMIGASSGALRGSINQCFNDVYIGTRAGYNFGGQNNTFIGTNAGSGSDTEVIIGSENVYVGVNSGELSNSNANTFVGANTGKINKGARNTLLGNSAGINMTSNISTENTFLGYGSGANCTYCRTNTFIGNNSDGIVSSNGLIEKSVAIGNNAKVSASNSMVLGGTGEDAVNVGIGNTAPQNKLEITSAAANTSGLRFTNLKSTSIPSVPNSLGLSVDANGDVILVSALSGGATPDSMLVKYVGTNKLVGLGIASPLEKLHISAGNLRVDNVLPRMYMKNTSTGTDITLAQLGTDNILKLANNAIQAEAFGGSPSIYIKNNGGNVGVGNITPNNKLEITSATTNTSGLRFTNLKSTSTPSASNSLGLSVDANGDVILVPAGGGTLPQGADVWDQLTNGADYLIRNKNNKSVMIGTVAATKTSIDYKLYVEKGILAEKVKISTQANWPDYVFAKNYSLMSLKEVENFITTNNHLPEVPSAEVIAKDGLDLGKMDATLLKKVEELTLYLIEQNKKIEVLQNELNTLKAKK